MQNARCKPNKKRNGLGRYLVFWMSSVLCLAVFVYAGLWGWYYIQKPSVFPIKHVEVRGAVHTDATALADLTRQSIQGGFFSLQLAGAKQQLLMHPWLKDVAFRRVWPDTLVVMLTERQAVARWKTNGLVSQSGVLFYPDIKTIDQALPQLKGPDDQVPVMLQTLQTFNEALKPSSMAVKGLQVSESGDWSVVLTNDWMVDLGKAQVLSRFERLMRLYKKLVASAQRPIAQVDCRYPNGFAVLYK